MTQNIDQYLHMLSSLKYIGKNSRIYPLAKIILPENIQIGRECIIEDFAFLYASGQGIIIGDFCHITAQCVIYARGLVTFEDFSAIAPGTIVLGETDDYKGLGFVGNSVFGDKYRNKTEAPVTFKRHAHVGSNSVIMPGVTIGEGCSIGAGSVVTKDMPAWTICYGSPCKPMRGKPSARQLQMEKDFLEEYYGENNV